MVGEINFAVRFTPVSPFIEMVPLIHGLFMSTYYHEAWKLLKKLCVSSSQTTRSFDRVVSRFIFLLSIFHEMTS